MKSFAKMMIAQKGAISLLENLKECFSKVLDQLKMIVPIPLNTQINFKNSLAVIVQLI